MLLTWLPAVACLLLPFTEGQISVHLSTDKKSWQDGEAYCVQRKGHLVAIHNAFQGTALSEMAVKSCQSFYTGGMCDQKKCSWSDGSKFDYTNFGPGQPTASGKYVSASAKNGYWQTVDGQTPDCFICSQDAVMTDCLDWKNAGYTDDGFYQVIVNKVTETVYCDMHTDGGGWTVIQRRIDGSDPFWNHTWSEFKNGFGVPDSNFWAGNEIIHQISTKDKEVKLRVDMKDDGTPGSAQANYYWWNIYDHFQVTAESDNYTIYLGIDDWQHIQGNASTGWYDITYSSGAPFSTVDRINDIQTDCVNKYEMGGWWLKNCALSSLNGAYIPKDWSTGYGLFWIVDGGDTIIHPRKTSMMMRRLDT